MGEANANSSLTGVVLFREARHWTPADFQSLQSAELSIGQSSAADGYSELPLTHSEWGTATLVIRTGQASPPPPLIRMDPGLTDGERDAMEGAQSSMLVKIPSDHGDPFRQRKTLLRFLQLVNGSEGVGAIDIVSQRLWSPAALDDELSHDADPDVEALYVVHAINDANDKCRWAHTHGLGEIDRFDFDIMDPWKELFGRAKDVFRAAAYAIVLQTWSMGQENCPLLNPGGGVAAVPVKEFMRKGPSDSRRARSDSPAHSTRRVVLCMPPKRRGIFELLGRRRPAQVLSRPIPEEYTLLFPARANDKMGDRARATYPMLRALAREFGEYKLPIAVKLTYPTTAGGGHREHMWFGVNDMHSDRIEATLHTEPHHVGGFARGDKGEHDPDLLSDWAIATPAGTISPRNTTPARRLREDPERYFKEARGQGSSNSSMGS